MFPEETRSTIAVGEAEPRRDLDRPGHVDELDLDGKQLAREAGIDRGDGGSGEVLDPLVPRLLGDGRLEPAGSEAELQQLVHPGSPLADEVLPGDAAVDDAVLDVLGHVGGSDEEDVDRCVSARERECALTRLLRPEAGVVEQRHRRLAEAPLDRDGDRQAVDASAFVRSSASR